MTKCFKLDITIQMKFFLFWKGTINSNKQTNKIKILTAILIIFGKKYLSKILKCSMQFIPVKHSG